MENDGDSEESTPSIEEGTFSPSLKPSSNTQSNTQEYDKEKNSKTITESTVADAETERENALNESFLRTTISEIKSTVFQSIDSVPVNVGVAGSIIFLTTIIITVSTVTLGVLTGFGVIFCLSGVYIGWFIYTSRTKLNPTSISEYILYYGTAILFFITGIQYLLNTI